MYSREARTSAPGDAALPSNIGAAERVYGGVRRDVLEARLKPGTRLVHRTLARLYGCSPVPVVAALRMLERDGLVVNTPGLGAYVRVWRREEIADLFRIRSFHEALASRLAAERATAADIEAITRASAAFEASAVEGNDEANVRADVAFHMAVVTAAHCSDLHRTVESLSFIVYSMRAFSLSLGIPRFFDPALSRIHDPIAQAIVARDADAAERLGRIHVEESLTRNLRWIETVAAAASAGVEQAAPWWAAADPRDGSAEDAARAVVELPP